MVTAAARTTASGRRTLGLGLPESRGYSESLQIWKSARQYRDEFPAFSEMERVQTIRADQLAERSGPLGRLAQMMIARAEVGEATLLMTMRWQKPNGGFDYEIWTTEARYKIKRNMLYSVFIED